MHFVSRSGFASGSMKLGRTRTVWIDKQREVGRDAEG
jgi:hypothetical protein